MPSHVVVNGLGLTYKSTIGLSIATIPDVCKTPSPGGPVPIPYPNIANQGSLDKGTKKVKAKGKMVAVKGSQYTRSNGDEAGTAGGVKSSVNMKATDWILYSFDVKMEGKNACRHTDKKFHNNQNTVDLAGNVDVAMGGSGVDEEQTECTEDSHIGPLEITDGDIDDDIDKGEAKKKKLKDKIGEFTAEKKAAGSNAAKARAQKKINGCLDGIRKIDSGMPSKLWEQKVASDLRQKDPNVRTNIKIRCKKCNKIIAEFDAVGDGVAKEAKMSSGGYKPEQHERQKKLVEGLGVFGAGVVVHVAVPAAQAAQLAADNAELAGRVQGH